MLFGVIVLLTSSLIAGGPLAQQEKPKVELVSGQEKFSTSYDRFKDETAVEAELPLIYKIYETKVPVGACSFSYVHKGKTAVRPASVFMVCGIIATVGTGEAPTSDLDMIVDGERLNFGAMPRVKKHVADGSLGRRVATNFFSKELSYRVVETIASAKTVEVRIQNNLEIRLTDAQLKTLREFVSYGSGK